MCFHFLQCTVLNLNGWFSSSRKCYFELFMYIGFSWECQGGLRVLARSDNHIFTFSVADENDVFLFQAGKSQQVCEQRLRSLESGLRGQQHYIRGIFWNLFVVLYSGILTLILLFTILYMVVTHAILRVISSECQFKSFRRLVTVPGSRSYQFLQIWWLTAVLLQHSGNTFEYVGPTRCRHIPNKDEGGWGRQNCRLLLYWLVAEISSFPLN